MVVKCGDVRNVSLFVTFSKYRTVRPGAVVLIWLDCFVDPNLHVMELVNGDVKENRITLIRTVVVFLTEGFQHNLVIAGYDLPGMSIFTSTVLESSRRWDRVARGISMFHSSCVPCYP